MSGPDAAFVRAVDSGAVTLGISALVAVTGSLPVRHFAVLTEGRSAFGDRPTVATSVHLPGRWWAREPGRQYGRRMDPTCVGCRGDVVPTGHRITRS